MRKKGIALVALLAFTVAASDADAKGRGGGKGGRSGNNTVHTPAPDATPKPDNQQSAKQRKFMPYWMRFILRPGGGSGAKCDDHRRAKGECQ